MVFIPLVQLRKNLLKTLQTQVPINSISQPKNLKAKELLYTMNTMKTWIQQQLPKEVILVGGKIQAT
jgi:hypothetical protein